jgi:hypothetical protein
MSSRRAVNAGMSPEASWLRFKCRFEPGAHVDVYMNLDTSTTKKGQLESIVSPYTHKYQLAGPDDPNAITDIAEKPKPMTFLGSGSALISDGAWHRIEINLSTLSQKQRPISDITIGNFSNADYLLAGLSGNKPGATFYLKDITIESREEPINNLDEEMN